MIGYIEGILKLANVFLSVIAGIIAISLIKHSHKKKYTNAWYILIIVLVLFAVQEILGALRAFQIFSTPYLTHIVPTLMLGLLIWAVAMEMRT